MIPELEIDQASGIIISVVILKLVGLVQFGNKLLLLSYTPLFVIINIISYLFYIVKLDPDYRVLSGLLPPSSSRTLALMRFKQSVILVLFLRFVGPVLSQPG